MWACVCAEVSEWQFYGATTPLSGGRLLMQTSKIQNLITRQNLWRVLLPLPALSAIDGSSRWDLLFLSLFNFIKAQNCILIALCNFFCEEWWLQNVFPGVIWFDLSRVTVVAWIGVKRALFSWTAGIPTKFCSSPNGNAPNHKHMLFFFFFIESLVGTRSFCPKCGTQILFEFTNAPEELDVTIASLDDPNQTPPKVHLWLSSSPSWLMKFHDDLPKFEKERIRTSM